MAATWVWMTVLTLYIIVITSAALIYVVQDDDDDSVRGSENEQSQSNLEQEQLRDQVSEEESKLNTILIQIHYSHLDHDYTQVPPTAIFNSDDTFECRQKVNEFYEAAKEE